MKIGGRQNRIVAHSSLSGHIFCWVWEKSKVFFFSRPAFLNLSNMEKPLTPWRHYLPAPEAFLAAQRWGKVYDHVAAMIGCHGGHMIGKLPIAAGCVLSARLFLQYCMQICGHSAPKANLP